VQIATLNSPKVTVNIAKVMVKRLTHTGSTLRPVLMRIRRRWSAAIEANVMPLLARGERVWVSRFHHYLAMFDGDLGAVEGRDLHDAAIDRGGIIVAVDVVAGDHIEDEVDARIVVFRLDHGETSLRL